MFSDYVIQRLITNLKKKSELHNSKYYIEIFLKIQKFMKMREKIWREEIWRC